MAPKKQTNLLTSDHLSSILPLSEFFELESTSFESTVDALFNEVFLSIDSFLNSQLDAASASNLDWDDINSKVLNENMRDRVAKLSIRRKNNSATAQKLNHKSTASKKTIKEEPAEVTEIVTTTPIPTEMDQSPSRPCTPPVTAVTTDEEMEAITIPKTVDRIQKMLISENTCHSSPSKSAFGSPRKPIIPPAFTTPSRAKHPVLLAAPAPSVFHGEVENAKIQHASEMKKKFLDQKVMKAKKQDEKRKMVKERHDDMQRKIKEKHEELRRKEEKTAEFQKNANLLRSPPRVRKVDASAKTPVPVKTKSVFEGSDLARTPGRRPAKFGRVEQLVAGETIAQATVNLSPSREPLRSVKRVKPTLEAQERKVFDKPVLKAKRQQSPSKEKLLAAQEAYLLEQCNKRSEEERIAAEEEEKENKRRILEQKELARKKKLEEEKKVEEERKKREEDEKWLKKVQEEEAERLRIETEKEQKAYEAAIAKQANKKALDDKKGKPQVACYEMTPPRVYVAPTKDDYGLDDLNSDDDTDQEDDPRKEVPAWADWAVVRRNVRNHHNTPPFDVDMFFGHIKKPDLKLIFGNNVHVKKRGSSAVWRSPAVGASKSIFGGIRK